MFHLNIAYGVVGNGMTSSNFGQLQQLRHHFTLKAAPLVWMNTLKATTDTEHKIPRVSGNLPDSLLFEWAGMGHLCKVISHDKYVNRALGLVICWPEVNTDEFHGTWGLYTLSWGPCRRLWGLSKCITFKGPDILLHISLTWQSCGAITCGEFWYGLGVPPVCELLPRLGSPQLLAAPLEASSILLIDFLIPWYRTPSLTLRFSQCLNKTGVSLSKPGCSGLEGCLLLIVNCRTMELMGSQS